MYLLLCIVVSAILGYVLLMLGPLVGGIIAFAIVVGCMFRGLYLLNNIHKKISTLIPNNDKVKEAYDQYIKEQEKA